MNKKTKTLLTLGLIGTASLGLLTGCELKDDNSGEKSTAYIQVEGLDTTWVQNQAISIEGAKIKYYENDKDEIPDVVDLRADMITNFNSSLVGNNFMKINYRDASLNVKYTIYSIEYVATVFNTAITNLKNAEKVKYVDIDGDIAIKSEGKYYNCEGTGNNKHEFWTVQEGDTWYGYSKHPNNMPPSSKVEKADFDVDNEMVKAIFPVQNFSELLNHEHLESFEVDMINNMYSLNINTANSKLTCDFKDGKCVKITSIIEGEVEAHIRTITYDASEIEAIPELPTIE